jgi:hypothetical protein
MQCIQTDPQEADMSRRRSVWNAIKNMTIVMSLVVNVILIVVVFVLLSQLSNIKATLQGVLNQLDSAFVSLGAAVIHDNIYIDQRVPVQFDLVVDQPGAARITQAVPLSIPATFSLGSFGTINGTVSLALPPGTTLPVQINMTVPVNNEIPVTFTQPVAIPLGERGLGPVIGQLRGVTLPLLQLVQSIPAP